MDSTAARPHLVARCVDDLRVNEIDSILRGDAVLQVTFVKVAWCCSTLKLCRDSSTTSSLRMHSEMDSIKQVGLGLREIPIYRLEM
jgi:hypothetical protein